MPWAYKSFLSIKLMLLAAVLRPLTADCRDGAASRSGPAHPTLAERKPVRATNAIQPRFQEVR